MVARLAAGVGLLTGAGLALGVGLLTGAGLALGAGLSAGVGLLTGAGLAAGAGLSAGVGLLTGAGLALGAGLPPATVLSWALPVSSNHGAFFPVSSDPLSLPGSHLWSREYNNSPRQGRSAQRPQKSRIHFPRR
jgi:hypothetical protein